MKCFNDFIFMPPSGINCSMKSSCQSSIKFVNINFLVSKNDLKRLIMVVMNFCALVAGDRPKMQIWTVLHLHEDRDAGTQRGSR